ncbi:velvet factor-domain-containing protein [Mycena filopes]|nr:velvet factor-domain-containing protein [Mycena filopes]
MRFGTASLVNTPIYFTHGQFAGKTVRATLEEVQAAAKVDRRPLDPAPVAYLRLFEVFNFGTAAETQVELDYEQIDTSGFTCMVDLFSVPRPESTNNSNASLTQAGFDWPVDESAPLSNSNSTAGQIELAPDLSGGNVTTKFAGNTFVQVDNIPWMGRPACLFFTFADLAVKSEGYFMLRYRFFDLFARAPSRPDPPIQAQCRGATFRVFSTKDAPPLAPSTELSKHLSRYGVRLNVRETVRKRKQREPSPGLPYTTHRLGDQEVSDGGDEDDAVAAL